LNIKLVTTHFFVQTPTFIFIPIWPCTLALPGLGGTGIGYGKKYAKSNNQNSKEFPH
jgi:hypothetical protein